MSFAWINESLAIITSEEALDYFIQRAGGSSRPKEEVEAARKAAEQRRLDIKLGAMVGNPWTQVVVIGGFVAFQQNLAESSIAKIISQKQIVKMFFSVDENSSLLRLYTFVQGKKNFQIDQPELIR